MLRGRSLATLPLLAVVALLPAVGPARASTLSVAGDTITLTDPDAVANNVTVNHGNNPGATANVRDQAGITPVPPCEEYFGLGYACPTAVRPTFVLDLGGGDDFAQVINSAAAGTHSELSGGDGDDQLWSDEGSDTLDGGAGDDELVPDRDHPSPGDEARGGPGVDHLQLAGVVSSAVVATLDDRADDGAPGERDNYHSDIENVTGSQVARNTIAGTARANTIVGQSQDDRLTGGGGRDRIEAGGGADTVDALDGTGDDRVDCGDGADVAYVDAGDIVARGTCERLTWAPAPSSSRLRYRARRIAVKLKCPKAAVGGCRGTLRLTRTGGKTLASKRYRAARGKAATVRLRLKRKPARTAILVVAPKGTHPSAGRAVRIR